MLPRSRLLRVLAPLLLLIAFAVGSSASAGAPPTRPSSATLVAKAAAKGPLHVLVTTSNKRTQATVARQVRASNAQLIRRYKLFPILLVRAGAAELRALSTTPGVIGLQEDLPEPPALASTVPLINADDIQNFGYTGTGLAVAILDTGIDRDHPFFGSR